MADLTGTTALVNVYPCHASAVIITWRLEA
jgi:hypothetical protein